MGSLDKGSEQALSEVIEIFVSRVAGSLSHLPTKALRQALSEQPVDNFVVLAKC